MGKPRSDWNWNTYYRRIKEGRGQGTLADYLPWLTIHDLASYGVVSRVLGFTTGRIHHLLSGYETAFSTSWMLRQRPWISGNSSRFCRWRIRCE